MKLEKYLELCGQSPEQFAHEIGVGLRTVHRYLAGDRRPDWDVMVAIKDVTGGAVTADDFVPTTPKKRQRGGSLAAASAR